MQAARKNEIIVGLFVVLGVVALLGLTFRISGTSGFDPFEVRATFRDVAGLEIGGPVLVSGFRIGRVTEMEHTNLPSGQPAVIVEAQIRRDIPIYRDASVRLVQQGFIGDKRLEIWPGTPDAGPIPDEGFMLETTVAPLDEFLESAGTIAEDARLTMAAIREAVSDEGRLQAIDETIASVQRAVDNIDAATTELRATIEENRPSIRASVQNVERVSERSIEVADRADQLVARTDEQITAIAEEARVAVTDIRERAALIGDRVDRIAEQAEGVTGNADDLLVTTRAEVQAVSARIEETSENLNALLVSIREGEGTVGRLINDPRPFEDLQESIAALRALIRREQEALYSRDLPYRQRPDAAADQ